MCALAQNKVDLTSQVKNKLPMANIATVPDTKYVPSAGIISGTASSSWNIPASGGPAATTRIGANTLDAALNFADTNSAQFTVALPLDWDSTTALNARLYVATSDVTSGHTIIMQLATSCEKGDGSTSDDVAFNTVQAMSTITLGTVGNQMWTATLTSMTTTGCLAGGLMKVKVVRGTDTATAAYVLGVQLTIPRALTVQAN
jgi:hypothetical protein